MNKLINFCGKYSKWIYAILTVALLLILCFPIQSIYDHNADASSENAIRVPFFVALANCFSYVGYMTDTATPENTLLILDIVSFCAFVIFVLLLIAFWIFKLKNKKFPFFTIFIPALAIYIMQGFFFTYSFDTRPNGAFETITTTSWYSAFSLSTNAIILIVFFCLYLFAVLFGKLYPKMQPKVAETVTKVADKVKAHKSKSQRIEELERQNEEIQRQLDELKRKD